jgi:hypothetical protein
MNRFQRRFLPVVLLSMLILFAACSSIVPVSQVQKQPTVTIPKSFQAQISPIPTFPPLVCGSWSSNNAPSPGGVITIYAKLTDNLAGVSGAVATATVNFAFGSVTLADNPISDSGGYVTFTLPLQNRQPVGVPATVSITFYSVPGHKGSVSCTQAFFTPQ